VELRVYRKTRPTAIRDSIFPRDLELRFTLIAIFQLVIDIIGNRRGHQVVLYGLPRATPRLLNRPLVVEKMVYLFYVFAFVISLSEAGSREMLDTVVASGFQ